MTRDTSTARRRGSAIKIQYIGIYIYNVYNEVWLLCIKLGYYLLLLPTLVVNDCFFNITKINSVIFTTVFMFLHPLADLNNINMRYYAISLCIQ